MAFFVVLRRRGPAWDPSLPLEQQSGWDEHAAFMDGLVDAGVVVLGGPLADERRVVLAVEADSEASVRSTLARDPWSGTHLVVDSVDAGRSASTAAGADPLPHEGTVRGPTVRPRTAHATRLLTHGRAAAVAALGSCPRPAPTRPPPRSSTAAPCRDPAPSRHWSAVTAGGACCSTPTSEGSSWPTAPGRGRGLVPSHRGRCPSVRGRLPAALATATNPSGEAVTVDDLGDYVRQYTGVEGGGARHLVVAALCRPDDFPNGRPAGSRCPTAARASGTPRWTWRPARSSPLRPR